MSRHTDPLGLETGVIPQSYFDQVCGLVRTNHEIPPKKHFTIGENQVTENNEPLNRFGCFCEIIDPNHCQICFEKFIKLEDLYTHLKSFHQGTLRNCEQCRTPKIYNQHQYQKHMTTFHPTLKKIYICGTCKTRFTRRDYFTLQECNKCVIDNVKEERPISICNELDLPCERCKNATKAKQSLSCDKCEEVFSNKSDIARHKENQHDTKKHKCSNCGKNYNRKDNLKRHKNKCKISRLTTVIPKTSNGNT